MLASHQCCIVAAFQASKPGLIGQLSAFDSASVASCSSAVQQHRILLQPVEIVLTAHPTQVMRRSLQHKQCRIGQLLHDLDRAAADASTAGTAAKDEVVNTIFREVMATWQTDEIRRNKPTPVEEAKSGLNILEQSLWTAIPAYASPLLPDPARAPTGAVPTVAETAATPAPETRRGRGAVPGTVQGSRPGVPCRYLRKLNADVYQVCGRNLPLNCTPIRFASWMGGDRDGNPNVTAQVPPLLPHCPPPMSPQPHRSHTHQPHPCRRRGSAVCTVYCLFRFAAGCPVAMYLSSAAAVCLMGTWSDLTSPRVQSRVPKRAGEAAPSRVAAGALSQAANSGAAGMTSFLDGSRCTRACV